MYISKPGISEMYFRVLQHCSKLHFLLLFTCIIFLVVTQSQDHNYKFEFHPWRDLKLEMGNMTIQTKRLAGATALLMSCTAPFPVKWTLDTFDLTKNTLKIATTRSERTMTDFWDPSTYKFHISNLIFSEHYPSASGIYTCRSTEDPSIPHGSIQFKYIQKQQFELTDVSFSTYYEELRIQDSGICPFEFHVRVYRFRKTGTKCVLNGNIFKYDSLGFVRGSDAELFSRKLNQNPACVIHVSENADCYGCLIHDIEQQYTRAAELYFCYTNGTTAGVRIIPNINEVNGSNFVTEDGPGYPQGQSTLQLEYLKHPFYFVGEKFRAGWNWNDSSYYFADGNLFLTIEQNGSIIHTKTISINVKETFELPRYQFSFNLTETGNMVVTVYAPIWNTRDWLNDSLEFAVREPQNLGFSNPYENLTFRVGDNNLSLVCNSSGDPEADTLVWKKNDIEYHEFLRSLPPQGQRNEYLQYINTIERSKKFSEIKTRHLLVIPEVTGIHGGLYKCVVRNRLGVSATKTFSVSLTDQHQRTFATGDNGSISCIQSAGIAEPMEYSWIKDNLNRPYSTEASISFTPVVSDNAGNYSCTAKSRLGFLYISTFSIFVVGGDSGISISPVSWANVLVPALIAAGILLAVSLRLILRLKMVLNDAEFKAFLDGRKNTETGEDQMISCLPYNRKYEAEKRQISIDMSCLLGSGQFSLVYRGTFISLDTLETVDVAVKTVKSSVNSIQILALLNELKILSFLGNGHNNVLNIIGACTSKAQYGEVYMCVELCERDLLSFLNTRKIFGSYAFNQSDSTELATIHNSTEHNYTSSESVLTRDALMRWALQIADGMDFLKTKNVIHGDLAARNILLSTKYSEVKIADFGLGRVLETYKYFKMDQQDCALPWQWMAIETLEQKKFSSASDVWAFGVTLWEMFTLGQTPYPGLTWSLEFLDELKSGLRLKSPEFGSEELYTLMNTCWKTKESDRPDFQTIKNTIATMLGTDCSGYSSLG